MPEDQSAVRCGSQPDGASSPSLYHGVVDALRTAMESGRLAGGSVIYEAALADVLQTSRTPVKLALDLLVQQGLVRKLGGRGYIVLQKDGAVPGERRRVTRTEFATFVDMGLAERSPAAWTRIYAEVEREISGQAAYGRARVIEHDLARHYGVSRTVAHDVLTRVERAGLIEKDIRSRWFVLALTPERVKHLYEVRRYLEPQALRIAAAHVPEELIDEMLARVCDALERYPHVSVHELDGLERDIHTDCIGYCGNPELIKLLRINQILLINNKHMLGGYLRLPDLDPFLGEHKAILDLLRERDPDAAAQAMDRHLRLSLPKVLTRLDHLSAALPSSPPPYLLPEQAR